VGDSLNNENFSNIVNNVLKEFNENFNQILNFKKNTNGFQTIDINSLSWIDNNFTSSKYDAWGDYQKSHLRFTLSDEIQRFINKVHYDLVDFDEKVTEIKDIINSNDNKKSKKLGKKIEFLNHILIKIKTCLIPKLQIYISGDLHFKSGGHL